MINTGNKTPKILKACVRDDEIILYEVKDSELDILSSGGDPKKYAAIFSFFVSFTISLLLMLLGTEKFAYSFFDKNVVILLIIISFICCLVSWHSWKQSKGQIDKIVEKIKQRLPQKKTR